MKKTYITNISLQSKAGLLKVEYEPKGFDLNNNRSTCFPIIPVIAANQEEGDEVTVLAVRSNTSDTPDNYAVFLEELSQVGIKEEQVEEISVEENQSGSVSMELLLTILKKIPDESVVYGDITFGTKPMSAILLYAMSFVEKMKNCEVEGIYYGEIPRKQGELSGTPTLYDLTMFKLLGDVIDQLKSLEIRDMETALNRLVRS